VYDQDQRAPKTGRRPPTFLTTKEWPAAGKWLEESIGITATELQKRLLERDFTTSSNRLRQYFAGERLPEPPTLRAICEAGDLSYVEAVDRFGYYREIIKIFDDLVWLGARWLEEDDARGGTVGPLGADVSHLRSLRDTGVIFWKGEPITWGAQLPWRDKPGLDPRGIPDFQDRYIDVEWRQLEHRAVVVKFPPIEIVPGGTFSMKAPYRLEDVDPSLSRESVDVPERSPHATLPKPIAVALLLAVLAFHCVAMATRRERQNTASILGTPLTPLSKKQNVCARTFGWRAGHAAFIHSCSAHATSSTIDGYRLTTGDPSPPNTWSSGRMRLVNRSRSTHASRHSSFGEKRVGARGARTWSNSISLRAHRWMYGFHGLRHLRCSRSCSQRT